jgi:hypothetical protein
MPAIVRQVVHYNPKRGYEYHYRADYLKTRRAWPLDKKLKALQTFRKHMALLLRQGCSKASVVYEIKRFRFELGLH